MWKPWHEYKTAIVRLYIDEGRTLTDVRGIMKDTYGFEASVRSYRQRFDAWKIDKYNCKKRNIRRQKKARARQSLPSPPLETPMVSPVSIQRLPRSPGSSTRNSSSSSSPGNFSETPSGLAQPRPYLRPPIDGQILRHARASFKAQHARCLTGEDPSSGLRGEIDVPNPALCNPSISNGISSSVGASVPNIASPGDDPRNLAGGNSDMIQCYGSAHEVSIPLCMPQLCRPLPLVRESTNAYLGLQSRF